MQETISKIEDRIRHASSLPPASRDELLTLLGQLKSQIGPLSQTDEEQARSIAGYAELSAHEATREKKNPRLLQHSVGGLRSSVVELEESHPQLVAVVNRFAAALANMGI